MIGLLKKPFYICQSGLEYDHEAKKEKEIKEKGNSKFFEIIDLSHVSW